MTSRFFAVHQDEITDHLLEVKSGAFRPKLAVGMGLVLFERQPDDIRFVSKSTVVEVQKRTDPQAEVEWQIAKISSEVTLDPPRLLSILAGSLEKVRFFLEPLRHFRKGIIALSPNDFEVIIQNQTFIARSVFRYLFSSLPLVVQAEFVRQHIEQFPLISEGRIREYLPLAKLIVEFVGEEVRSPLFLLNQIATAYPRLSNVPQLASLHFSDAKGGDFFALGSACVAARELFQASGVLRHSLTTDGEQARLDEPALPECLAQLSDVSDAEIARKWNDPIF